MAADIDREGVEKAYGRWAPVYDLVFGKVFDEGRRSTKIGRAHVELQSRLHLVCRLLLEKKKKQPIFRSDFYTDSRHFSPDCASASPLFCTTPSTNNRLPSPRKSIECGDGILLLAVATTM